MRFQTATVALLASVATLVPVLPGPASAGIDPASYQIVNVFHDYPAPFGHAGGFISCPAGMKAVASGTTSSGLRDVFDASLTTFDGNGAFATGSGNGGDSLQISVRCVDAAQVQGSTLARMVVRDHQPPPAGFSHNRQSKLRAGPSHTAAAAAFLDPASRPASRSAPSA